MGMLCRVLRREKCVGPSIGTTSCSDEVPVASTRMAPLNSDRRLIVAGWTHVGYFTRHWSTPLELVSLLYSPGSNGLPMPGDWFCASCRRRNMADGSFFCFTCGP